MLVAIRTARSSKAARAQATADPDPTDVHAAQINAQVNALKSIVGFGIDLTSDTTDERADRALSTVARKLEKTLSVEYVVNELIAQATDTANLANMYAGEQLGFRIFQDLFAYWSRSRMESSSIS
jgi:hypothetical protein